jgi:cell division protein FtsA
VGEPAEDGLLEVAGLGEAEAKGLRKGVVVNPDAAVEGIRKAVEDAERMSGLEVSEVMLNLSGTHVMGLNGQAIVAISGRDREITADDVQRAVESACAVSLPAGREIVDRLAQEFIVDDQDGINDPVGMIGARMAVKVHIITSPITSRQNAINAVNRAGLAVGDMALEQIAAAEAALTDDDKEFGCALVNIGAETTGLVIYQRGAVQYTAVFPIGGTHFTNDIAFGLRTPIPEAERIKRAYGCAYAPALSDEARRETIEAPSVSGRGPRQLSRQILCDILQPRAEEVLLHVADDLRNNGWDRLLSSGVVLTGGGARLPGLDEIAEQVFDAPVRVGRPEADRLTGLAESLIHPDWAVATGLALLGQRVVNAENRLGHGSLNPTGRFVEMVARFRDRFSGIL